MFRSGFRLLPALLATLAGHSRLSDGAMAAALQANPVYQKRKNPHMTRINCASKGPRLGRATGPNSYAEESPQQAINRGRRMMRELTL